MYDDYSCKRCLEFEGCEILSKIAETHKAMEEAKERISYFLKQKKQPYQKKLFQSKEDKENYELFKELDKRYLEAKGKRIRCLNKRIWWHENPEKWVKDSDCSKPDPEFFY